MSPPVLSNGTIARNERELKGEKQRLPNQIFDKLEIFYSTVNGIARVWEEELSQANRRLVLFTETGTCPIYHTWLETLVERSSEEQHGFVHLGEFLGSDPFSFSNTAIYGSDSAVSSRRALRSR
jgi:hypothetical protein